MELCSPLALEDEAEVFMRNRNEKHSLLENLDRHTLQILPAISLLPETSLKTDALANLKEPYLLVEIEERDEWPHVWKHHHEDPSILDHLSKKVRMGERVYGGPSCEYGKYQHSN